MKIKETIERDCCQDKDLKLYRGKYFSTNKGWVFCVHCGNIWEKVSYTDAAGGKDYKYEIIQLPLVPSQI